MIVLASSVLPLFALALVVAACAVIKLLSVAMSLGKAFESEEGARDVSLAARGKRFMAGVGVLTLVVAVGSLCPEDTSPTQEEVRAWEREARRHAAAEKFRADRATHAERSRKLAWSTPIRITNSGTIVMNDPYAREAAMAAAAEAARYEAQAWKPDPAEEAEIQAAEAAQKLAEEREQALFARLRR